MAARQHCRTGAGRALSLVSTTAACLGVVHGHGILSKPKSKSSGTLKTPHEESLTSYFALASYGIIDKAFFDGDHAVTPWHRPGAFDHEAARDLIPSHPQTLHPCGCNAGGVAQCVGVGAATEFGETTRGAAQGEPVPVVPPEWPTGSHQETAWNAYANHAGGYIYMLCKKTSFDACRDTHMPQGALLATQAEKDSYLGCVWSCFESTTLEWVPGSQKIQYQDDSCSYVSTKEMEKVGEDGHLWRFMPIPDTTQVTLGGEGVCTWEAVTSFSNNHVEARFIESFGTSDVCDTGPHAHGPKNWHIMDKVKVPENIPEGEYLLGWRWDAYMADQLWTGCADISIVSSYSSADATPMDSDCPSNQPIVAPVAPPVKAPVEPPVAAPVSDAPVLTPMTNAPVSSPTWTNPTDAPVSTASPTVNPPSSNNPTKTPVANPMPKEPCSDLPLPGNWGADGRTCKTYYDHGGIAYCTHTEIEANCCFCGGGAPVVATMAPTMAPSCQDHALPGNWGANGLYTCDFYEAHGGTAYCAHAEIDDNCCFCGGGD